MTMARQDKLLGWGLILGSGASVAAAMSLQILVGYLMGVLTTVTAAAAIVVMSAAREDW
jgi:hypothetical protein